MMTTSTVAVVMPAVLWHRRGGAHKSTRWRSPRSAWRSRGGAPIGWRPASTAPDRPRPVAGGAPKAPRGAARATTASAPSTVPRRGPVVSACHSAPGFGGRWLPTAIATPGSLPRLATLLLGTARQRRDPRRRSQMSAEPRRAATPRAWAPRACAPRCSLREATYPPRSPERGKLRRRSRLSSRPVRAHAQQGPVSAPRPSLPHGRSSA